MSAVVIVPEGPAPPGGRPVLAWAHPTTGLADRCAPSRTPLVFALIPALDRILRSGWVVVATDYQGLGTPGHHPYLVADSEGHSLLDSVRAARTLTSTANEVALYGWSQGGHAALSAGQSAATYAPDLDLVGVAVDAPGGDLSAAFRAQESNPKYWTVLAFILQAYANEYGVPAETLQGLLTPPAQAAFAKFVAVCPVAPDTQSERLDLVRALAGIDRFFATDPLTTGPWSSLLSQNSPGGAPIPAPVRINQGSTDDLSLPDLTRAQADRLQQTGTSVDYVVYPGIGHPGIGAAAATDTLDWFNQGLGR
ncbi:MAG: alpha/beta fold hydrolase [Microthrixaceae bacterium]